ncbi:spore coat protein [Jeotgalibacillus proteolyticus]|uniref:Spore coat protein n=1 Tax=Jeotgalibacillus proteolyticus TaxID=2082395 RepID=A0A2S5GCP4_9BACL|nr:spore coat protein [Jeotgalibacillus proteolyticus]PPA70802.1 spore coat protein [Jeotgalibacillus proteolyticus]
MADHLAWHETLEIHELVTAQSIGLIKLKMTVSKVTDPALSALYADAINGLSENLRELVQFYPLAPSAGRFEDERNDEVFYAGDLLLLFKSSVRNYAIAITETATPALREVLKRQLNGAIDSLAKAFNYMYERGEYPSYDLNALLQHDLMLAQKALSL